MTNYRVGNYNEVIAKANKINVRCKTGINQIRVLSYISLSHIKTNNYDEGKIIYQFLRDTYPIFDIFNQPDTEEEYISNLEFMLFDYVPQTITSSSSELTNTDFFTSLPFYFWFEFFLLLLATLAIYEKIRNRIAKKKQLLENKK